MMDCLIISCFYQNFDWVSTNPKTNVLWSLSWKIPRMKKIHEESPEIGINASNNPGLPASRQSVKLPIHDEIEKGMNPGPLNDPPVDRGEGEDLFPDSPHPPFQLL